MNNHDNGSRHLGRARRRIAITLHQFCIDARSQDGVLWSEIHEKDIITSQYQ
jgi:hypothetical protein